jgi:MFS-type transporter involved in bile tolerance (Atg22 family)
LCTPSAKKQQSTNVNKNGSGMYVLSILFCLVAGFVDVRFGDLLLTALFVLAATMVMGALRPERPWRWTLLVAVFVPVAQGVAYLLLTKKPYRAQIYESFLGFLTGIAGAYGGSTARRGLGELFRK